MDIIVTPLAQKQLADISDKRAQQGIERAIDSLETDPDKKGKALIGNLMGYRSIRAVAQRYRVIYKIDESTQTVMILALGMRKEGDKADIYALARKLVQTGLLTLFVLLILSCSLLT